MLSFFQKVYKHEAHRYPKWLSKWTAHNAIRKYRIDELNEESSLTFLLQEFINHKFELLSIDPEKHTAHVLVDRDIVVTSSDDLEHYDGMNFYIVMENSNDIRLVHEFRNTRPGYQLLYTYFEKIKKLKK